GGWCGYLSYDLTDPAGRHGPLPAAAWGWTAQVLRLDTSGQWWFEALLETEDDQASADALADELEGALGRGADSGEGWSPGRPGWPSERRHHAAVRSCLAAIAAGELSQANVCTRVTASFDGRPAQLFATGVDMLRPARAAYVGGGWGAVVSLSPELFLSRIGDTVRSSPIKGMMARRNPDDDHLAEVLRKSTKDVAENVMITDLVRSDIGRVCNPGSVRVPEPLTVRPAPGVWHLDSTVVGELTAGLDDA